jgi:dienelactone hydrolase
MLRACLVLLVTLFAVVSNASPYPVVRKPTPFKGARLFAPNDDSQHTAVIMLHGSEGGSTNYLDGEANILVIQGYAVLVLCYFDCERGLVGPRQSLMNVEVTLVFDAIKWLRDKPFSNQKVVVYGFSRGAELALITGSLASTTANPPDAIIAHAGSDTYHGPWNWSWKDPICWLCKAGPGKCPKGSPTTDYRWNFACGPDDPNQIDRTISAWLLNGAKIKAGDRIAIESFQGPILLTVGEADEVWPSDQTRRLESALTTAGRKPEVHYFPGAGHVFMGIDEIHRRELVLDFLGRVPDRTPAPLYVLASR